MSCNRENKKQSKLKTTGRVERIDLPDFGIEGIKAKIDTGAMTSSINCSYIKKEKVNGEDLVVFTLLDEGRERFRNKTYRKKIARIKSVKSSNGESAERIFIHTDVKIFGESTKILMSLSDRSNLKYSVLLGRRFLNNRFLVNPAKKYLSKKQK